MALALLAAFTLAGQPAQAYEKDKTYKITILRPTIITVTSGAANTENTDWRRKTLVDGIRKEVAEEGAAYCCFPVATLIPAYRSPICRMRNLIFGDEPDWL